MSDEEASWYLSPESEGTGVTRDERDFAQYIINANAKIASLQTANEAILKELNEVRAALSGNAREFAANEERVSDESAQLFASWPQREGRKLIPLLALDLIDVRAERDAWVKAAEALRDSAENDCEGWDWLLEALFSLLPNPPTTKKGQQ